MKHLIAQCMSKIEMIIWNIVGGVIAGFAVIGKMRTFEEIPAIGRTRTLEEIPRISKTRTVEDTTVIGKMTKTRWECPLFGKEA